jgi:UDP-3-O-[3-hydroxymyristoyl] N-acetylglucosamine deacetylase
MSHLQTTLARQATLTGVGVHSGAAVTMVLKPAPADSGVSFVRNDLPGAPAIPATADSVSNTMLATVIGAGEATVSTVEHLMATFAGLGVDNAVVEIDGPETPIMDGSADDFVAAVDAAGIETLVAPRRFMKILAPIEIATPGKRAALLPAERFELAVEIAFDAPAIGTQAVDIVVDAASFRAELAGARTFGFIAEVEQLRAAGFGKGASLDNTIVVDGATVLNPDGLRRPDEFVRHKAMDALGDLAMLGAPVIGRFESVRGGHALNNQLVRAVLARPEAWRMVTLAEAG